MFRVPEEDLGQIDLRSRSDLKLLASALEMVVGRLEPYEELPAVQEVVGILLKDWEQQVGRRRAQLMNPPTTDWAGTLMEAAQQVVDTLAPMPELHQVSYTNRDPQRWELIDRTMHRIRVLGTMYFGHDEIVDLEQGRQPMGEGAIELSAIIGDRKYPGEDFLALTEWAASQAVELLRTHAGPLRLGSPHFNNTSKRGCWSLAKMDDLLQASRRTPK